MEKKVLMELYDLKKYYIKNRKFFFPSTSYVKAVDGVSLKIYEGETLGIVGESGCGKSTLGKLLVGLEGVTEGKISYLGEDFSRKEVVKKYRTKVQMVFQNTFASLNPRRKIYDLLYAPLHYHAIVPKENVNQEIDRLLEMVDLDKDMKQRYPHEFSGGQRQRIGIARALSLNPKFVVWDEPVSALDASVSASVLNLLKKLQKELSLTSVFIGHGLMAVRFVSDRIAVMYLGQIVELARAEELFEHPIHPYTKALLDAAPILDPKKRSERLILTGEALEESTDEKETSHKSQGCVFYARCPFALASCKEHAMKLELVHEVIHEYDAHYLACPVKRKEITEI